MGQQKEKEIKEVEGMETRQITINVPTQLRLGQLLYNVLRENGFESYVKLDTFADGKWNEASHKGVDCFYIDDEDLLTMIEVWNKENLK